MDTIRNGRFVIEKLKSNGHEAYYVGGCVRDHLLGFDIHDIDITTSAKPYEVMDLFKSKPTGLKYGTVTVLHEKINIEVTTFRIDGPYENHRKPEEVSLTDSAEEDVKRRDFTINGLLMDEQYNVIDYVGGQKDLEDRMIRAIGDAEERFEEDCLRILRAAYFQSKLGFQITRETRDAMRKKAHLIDTLPNERVLNEMIKILQGEHQLMALNSLKTTGVQAHLPGLTKGIEYVTSKMDERLFIDAFFVLSFSLNGSVDDTWKFSNVHKTKYTKAVELVLKKADIDALVLYENGLEISTLANKVMFLLGYKPNEKSSIQALFDTLPLRSISDLKVRGSDILKITDKKQGAWLSQLLDELVRKVLSKELDNTYDALMTYCKEKLQ